MRYICNDHRHLRYHSEGCWLCRDAEVGEDDNGNYIALLDGKLLRASDVGPGYPCPLVRQTVRSWAVT